MSEQYAPHDQDGPSLTRRTFLGVMALGIIGFVGNEAPQRKDKILPSEDMTFRLPDVKERLTGISYEPLDAVYVLKLLRTLEQKRGTTESRVEAAKKSLHLAMNVGVSSVGTAFQIDESGIFLTVKHVVSNASTPNIHTTYPFILEDPFTGESVEAVDFALHPKADMAIIHAPNGKPRKPFPGLQLDFSHIPDGEALWMISLYPGNDGHIYSTLENGRVDRSKSYPSTMGTGDNAVHMESAAQLEVTNMIPSGGTSGGSIVNSQGAIVGLEVGTYPNDAPNRSQYTGAKIVPLSYALSLPSYIS